MMNLANSGVMANLSLNLSRQSLDLLRYTLCEQKQHQQQETEHILEMLGQSQASAHIPNSAGVLLSQLKSLQRPQAYIMNSQGAEHLIPNEHSVTKFAFKYVLKPMSALDANLDYYSSGFWQSSGDQRSSSLPFMSGGPWKLLFATMIYLYLVKRLLPRAMKRQSALELNWPLRAYNLLMIVSNIFAFYHGCRLLDFGRKCFGCEVINHQDYSHAEMELLNYGWLFLLSRLLEWLDTIFFVLRKKDSQVTKLHVFHHSFVPLICWTYLKYHPGKTVAFFPLVNTFVHSIMYTYYFLATFGRAIQPYLWWKKYLTSLQIAQFVLILIQLATIPLSSHEGCQYPRGFLYVAFAGAILFLWLFYTYYIETYKTVGSKQQIAMRNPKSKTPGDSASLHKKRQQALGREGTSSALSDVIEDAICSESSSFRHASMKLD